MLGSHFTRDGADWFVCGFVRKPSLFPAAFDSPFIWVRCAPEEATHVVAMIHASRALVPTSTGPVGTYGCFATLADVRATATDRPPPVPMAMIEAYAAACYMTDEEHLARCAKGRQIAIQFLADFITNRLAVGGVDLGVTCLKIYLRNGLRGVVDTLYDPPLPGHHYGLWSCGSLKFHAKAPYVRTIEVPASSAREVIKEVFAGSVIPVESKRPKNTSLAIPLTERLGLIKDKMGEF